MFNIEIVYKMLTHDFYFFNLNAMHHTRCLSCGPGKHANLPRGATSCVSCLLGNTVQPLKAQTNIRAKAANLAQFNQIQVNVLALNVQVVCLQINL